MQGVCVPGAQLALRCVQLPVGDPWEDWGEEPVEMEEVLWCSDCPSFGQTCGWDPLRREYDCLPLDEPEPEPEPEPEHDPCPDGTVSHDCGDVVDLAGSCSPEGFVYRCLGAGTNYPSLVCEDCPSWGLGCGWDPGSEMFTCQLPRQNSVG